MMKKPAILTAMLVALLAASAVALAGAPAAVLAQDTEERAEGKFRLTLEGPAPENVSFRVESNVGDGGVICTTDAAMVETGIAECRDGGGVNEMSYSVPAGSTFEYRIVGSQGVELSQETIAEGSKVAEDGFVVDATFSFSGEPIGDEPSGTQPEDSPSTDDDSDGTDGDGAAGDQYEDDSSDNDKESSDKEDSGKEDSDAEDGVLPDTGGFSLALVAGAALLLAASGFLAYRSIS